MVALDRSQAAILAALNMAVVLVQVPPILAFQRIVVVVSHCMVEVAVAVVEELQQPMLYLAAPQGG